MTRSEILFDMIDKGLHPIQNYRRFKNIVRETEFVYDENYPDDCTGEFYYDPEIIKKGEKVPVIVNIHGGGFVKGDKKHRESLCGMYANRGYFVLNINYRLSPKFQFPAGVLDGVKAVNYLVKVEEKYNLDLDKVVLTGDSAGAYYASMVVAVAHNETLREKLGCDKLQIEPACLASFCGPYDLPASIVLTKLPFQLVWDMGHCLLDDDTFQLKKDFSNINDYKLINEISPIKWVNEKWCPSFLAMASRDVFCKGQGEALENKLKEAGVRVYAYKSKKLLDNHCFHLDMYKAVSRKCFNEMFNFVEDVLK